MYRKIRDGDIYFFDIRTGINIYAIPGTLRRIESVFNSILFYSGNNSVPQIYHKGQSPFLREALYKVLTKSSKTKDALQIKYPSPGVALLHDIYQCIEDNLLYSKGVLEDSRRLIAATLSNHANLNRLNDGDHVREILKTLADDIECGRKACNSDAEMLSIINRIETLSTEARFHLLDCAGL